MGFVSTLLYFDATLSSRLAVCARIGAPRRAFFKTIEGSGHGAIWIVIALAAVIWNGVSNVTIDLAAGILLDLIVSAILKLAFRRPRPRYDTKDMMLPSKVDDYSFPSGHASRFGFLLGLVFHHFFSMIPCFGICLWTILILFSRLALGRHYLTDIVAGLFVGCLEFFFIHAYDDILARPFQ